MPLPGEAKGAPLEKLSEEDVEEVPKLVYEERLVEASKEVDVDKVVVVPQVEHHKKVVKVVKKVRVLRKEQKPQRQVMQQPITLPAGESIAAKTRVEKVPLFSKQTELIAPGP